MRVTRKNPFIAWQTYLNFELKDLRPPEAARQSNSDLSDFDVVNAEPSVAY